MGAPRKDLGGLKPPFRSAIVWLIFLIEKEGLPLIVFETYRGAERQNALKESGSSKAGAAQSPHNFGLACDFVLDVTKCPVRTREWPKAHASYTKTHGTTLPQRRKLLTLLLVSLQKALVLSGEVAGSFSMSRMCRCLSGESTFKISCTCTLS